MRGNGLDDIKREFTKWRMNRNGKKHIPERLWNLVVNLPESYSVHEITKTLGLDWRKVKKLRENVKSESVPVSPLPFIEISPSHFDQETEVEVERPDGGKMRFKVRSVEDVNSLVHSFLKSHE